MIPDGDLDNDNVTNLQAWQNGWDLLAHFDVYDVGWRHMTNVWEVEHGSIPMTGMTAWGDPDGDGLFTTKSGL